MKPMVPLVIDLETVTNKCAVDERETVSSGMSTGVHDAACQVDFARRIEKFCESAAHWAIYCQVNLVEDAPTFRRREIRF
jgi:hypothetical protein